MSSIINSRRIIVSIVTVVYNNAKYVRDTIQSVLSQNYDSIEYIVIDGGSTDGTIEILEEYKEQIAVLVSEQDDGIYDAMNKGIAFATGDIIGILNSDDFYIDKFVIEKVVQAFSEQKVDSLFADLVYVRPDNLEKIVRLYDSSQFGLYKIAYGWIPAHPTFFIKREIYQKYGMFRTDLKNAADYDIFIRFLHIHKISYYYLPEVIIKMRTGGVSTSLRSIWINNAEVLRVCNENGIKTNIFKILSKYPKKIMGVFKN